MIYSPIRFFLKIFTFSALLFISNLSANINEKLNEELITELVEEHGFDEQYVASIFNQISYLPQLIENISKPAEKTKTWEEYRSIFITPKRIAAGILFSNQHKELLARVENETGVPKNILLGILGVETSFGRIQGNYRVIDSLYTLVAGYPPRSDFFKKQLIHLFYLSREQNLPIESIKGSYAGAMGAPQFIPSSYRDFAIDGNSDGKIDLFNSWDDVLMSIGNYLEKNGWRSNENILSEASLAHDVTDAKNGTLNDLSDYFSKAIKPNHSIEELKNAGFIFSTSLPNNSRAQPIYLEGSSKEKSFIGFHNFYVITTYNRNVMYALAVYQLGESIQLIVD
ncbi:MAG: lytic murein transglycosylase B [Gammaproteobacteria bacterium]|jgi:membrane-bound lytic murein transglycosylase B|nr:lytic murein transglycosylase B [Gammaproteobacteria bacterium]